MAIPALPSCFNMKVNPAQYSYNHVHGVIYAYLYVKISLGGVLHATDSFS